MNDKIKIITMCGSYKYFNIMKEVALDLELQGNCVLTPIDLTKPKENYTEEDFIILNNMHKEKIKISDSICVVNVDNYIGDNTKNEINFASSLGKEIIYYTDLYN